MSSHRPNLIYVFADQLRYQSLGYAGDSKAITPHIDRFAAEGANLVNAVSTYPVCAPYRASLFTGKYVTSHGMVINELRLNPNQRCLGHVLSDADYQTAYIGKWHLYANEFGNHNDPKNSFVPRGPYRLGFNGEWKAYGFNHEYYQGYYHTESPAKHYYDANTYEPDGQTDEAINFLRRVAPSEQPFALVLSWGPPHSPWTTTNVPEHFLQMFVDMPFPHPPNYKSRNDEPYADKWATLTEEGRNSLEEWRRIYYAQTASIDWNFGRLLHALDELGISENTVIVFTSDHGEMMGAQGRKAKNIFYEEACRVPMLIRWPAQIPKNTVTDVCLSTVDIMPTLLAMMELDCPSSVEGMDLSPFALGRSGPEPKAALMQGTGACAIWEDGYEWRALRDKQYTYAVYRVDGKELLFDNVQDPYQLNDRSSDNDYGEIMEYFRQLLKDMMVDIKDNFSPSTFYERNWTDGHRNIIRSATSDFSG